MKEINLPEEFEVAMKSMLGESYAEFRKSQSDVAPVGIRLNPEKACEIPDGASVPWSKDGYILGKRPVFTLDPCFHAGAYYVQEASSMFLEHAFFQCVDVDRPLIVLDLCAAPGGKSTHLLSLLNRQSLLVANETIRSRTAVLHENLQKWGHCNALITQNDPRDFIRVPGFFDVVVVDAPCSGEGLFRKDGAAVKQWSPENVARCVNRQRRILNDVWPALKEGGVLIYSTCTYNRQENEENLRWLYKNYQVEFLPLKTDPRWSIEHVSENNIEGYRFYSHKIRGEGFFYSIMKKTGATGDRSTKSAKSVLERPSRQARTQLGQWVRDADKKFIFQMRDKLHFIPSAILSGAEMVAGKLRMLAAGTTAGTLKHGRFVPHHALALSIELNRDNIKAIHLSRSEALRYLHKEPVNLPGTVRGFAVTTYEDLALGWINVLDHRTNNLYPPARRIRMDIS